MLIVAASLQFCGTKTQQIYHVWSPFIESVFGKCSGPAFNFFIYLLKNATHSKFILSAPNKFFLLQLLKHFFVLFPG